MGYLKALRDIFFPERVDFLDMLLKQTESTLKGVRALKRFMEEPNAFNAGIVKEVESETDDIRLEIIKKLNKTFVTPIDREDIFSLSRAIDDIVDYAQRTVEEMLIYKVEPTPKIRKIVDVLVGATEDIYMAVKNLKEKPEKVLEYVIKAKKAENHIEHIYLEALADLFENKDTIYILKMRELYRHLSNSADRCDEAANVISDVVMKIS